MPQLPSLPFADSLCHRCAAPPKYVRTATSLFIRCPILDEKYPRQPVRACPAYHPAVIATERLVLREMVPDDEPFIATLTDSLYGVGPHEWLFRMLVRYRRDGHGLWLALERDSGAPVGAVGLLKQWPHGVPEPEVSYHLHVDQRRRGFAVEAARAVVEWAFARGNDYVIALIRDDNVASQSVAKKLGMRPGDVAMHGNVPHRVWRLSRA
jgi:RimJ/RimL family protein N-acetyltransferase